MRFVQTDHLVEALENRSADTQVQDGTGTASNVQYTNTGGHAP